MIEMKMKRLFNLMNIMIPNRLVGRKYILHQRSSEFVRIIGTGQRLAYSTGFQSAELILNFNFQG